MRHVMIRVVLVGLLVVLPIAATAGTVFHLDTPHEGATVFGLVEVRGWILDDGQECGPPPEWRTCDWAPSAVSSIELFVDDAFVAEADLGLPRWDVLQAYPWYAGTLHEKPGFSVSFNADQYTSGEHSLYLLVTFSDMTKEPFGQTTVSVDPDRNQAPFGELEMPGEDQPMNGVFPLTGWALDDEVVTKIEIVVDGLIVGGANSGIHRPDIMHRFPSHPGAEYAGFIRMLNTTELVNGMHTVAVRLTDNEGAVRVVGRRFVQTFNTAYNLPPFGGIDWPIPNHIMYAVGCDEPGDWSAPPFEEPRVVELVTGWALDVGSSTDRGGVAYLQLLVDGTILSDTYEGSVYWQWQDIDVNYYGHERLDILRMFPDVPNAKDAGFAFRMDMSDLINRQGFREGLHYLKVRAGDLENNVTDIAQIPVIFDCDDDPDRPSWGDIYSPVAMEMVAGVVEVTGWAIDLEHIQQIEVWVDGEFIDYVDDMNLYSPEVRAMYPWLSTSLTEYAGYRYDFDTVSLNITDGEHVLVIRTEDRWGGVTMIGERVFVVDNLKKNAILVID